MPRDQHDKKINDLQSRHEAVLKKFTTLQQPNLEWWRHPWITTVIQVQFLESLVEQLEATHLAAHTAAQNLNLALQVVIEANKQAK